jgi:hypothetical protein
MGDFILSSESKKTARSRTTTDGNMLGVWSDLDEFISWREFAEVRHRSKLHYLGLLCVRLKAFHRAPVNHGRRTSPKRISHLMDLDRLALLRMSSVNKLWLTQCCCKISVTSSV